MAQSTVEYSEKVVVGSTEEAPILVLHVDDEASFLKVTKQILEMQGAFRVETALSVGEAVEKMRKKTYDVIVCDYIMPRRDGLQFLKELRDSDKNMPFVIFTGKGREDVAIKALNLGADRYFSKIGSPETVYGELAHGLRQAVERRRAEGRIRESEEELRSMLDAAVDGIAYVDPSGKIITANKRLVEEILGYDLDETVGKNFIELGRIEPEELPRVLKAMAEVIATGRSMKSFEVTLIKKDGTRIPTEINTGVVKKEGKVVGITTVVRDITERKEAEKELMQAEEKHGTLLGTANVLVQSVNAEGRFIYVNKEWKKMLGYTDKDLQEITLMDVIRKDHRGFCMSVFKQVMKGSSVRNVEAVFVAKDGKEIVVRGNARPIFKDGVFVSTVGFFVDITERKKAEELYRSVVELSPSSIITVDSKGVITSCNPAAIRMLGYSRDEMIGRHFSKTGVIRVRTLPKLLKLFSSVLRGKVTKPLELTFQRKDGTPFLAEVRVGLLKEGGKTIGIQAISTDITERKRTEKMIRESQQKFEGLFRDNPEAAAYVGPDFRILDVNPRFTKFFGYSLDEIKGKRLSDVIVPNDKMEEGKTLDKKAQEGYVYHNSIRKRKDGSSVPVSISAAPITVEGQLIGYVGLYKDISQLKSMEKAVRETMIKLAEMNEKLRVVGRLTRHDVRNKLSAVNGNIYLAKRKLADGHEVQEYLREVESAVRQVEKIFDFAGNYEMLGVEELAYVDVEKILEEAVSLFSDLQGVDLINDCRGLTLVADSLLRQLFYNLIHNSLMHCEKISQIRVYYEEEGKDKLRLVYEDDGVGIPKDEKEEIFRESYGKGTGYGLYLIRKICEVYGWSIQETGKQGKGAQFTITIPMVKLSRNKK